MGGKVRAPSSKLQRNTKSQIPSTAHKSFLDFGAWSFSGAWSLELGASLIRFLVLAPRISNDRAFPYFLALIQVAADGAVTAGDNFLAFFKSVGDFPVGVIADADFNGNHFHALAFEHKNDFDRFGGFF